MSTYRIRVEKLVPGTKMRWERKSLTNVRADTEQEALEKALQMLKDRAV